MAPPATLPDDDSLISRISARDPEALSRLYDRYRSVVYSLAMRVLRDPAEAEEVLTDVFLQAWRSAATFDAGRGSVGAWLTTLARSRAIDRLRARGRREAVVMTMDQETMPEAAPAAGGSDLDGPEKDADTMLKRRRIGAALASLSPEQRAALEMAYYGGYSQSEIAAKLREPLGTVKTRMRQGLIALKQNLAGQFQ